MNKWELVGPIVFKTAHAAAFLYSQSLTDATMTSKGRAVVLTDGSMEYNGAGTLLASYSSSSNTIVLAFQVRTLNNRLLLASTLTLFVPLI